MAVHCADPVVPGSAAFNAATVLPAGAAATVTLSMASGAYHVNLPLYNGTKSLEIGVPKDASFTPIPPRTIKPILFYGTSITQGGCASRSGMSYQAILGRILNIDFVNLGFSGNGVG